MSAAGKLVQETSASARARMEQVEQFVPRRFLSNGHLQTLVGNFLPRTYRLPEAESRIIEVDPGGERLPASHVLCHCHWQANRASRRLTVVLVHGLEGSSDSRYMKGIAARAWAAG